MSFEEFQTSVAAGRFPAALNPPLQALWRDGGGDWPAAHAAVQDEGSREAAWVHAYLHRKEGDVDNAAYWYARARQPVAAGELGAEWETITRALLSAPGGG